jgi:adenine-specific DNA-methyltransferase
MSRSAGQGVLPFESNDARLDHPYLTRQLIAYIGNKRKLQPLLCRVFTRLLGDRIPAGNRGGGCASAPVFLDPFAGSGSVARLARYLGCQVRANDWEYYAYVLNCAHLCVGESEARDLFCSHGGLAAVLEELNGLPDPAEEDRYISRHYAPQCTETADYRRERLFYTRENALIIDAVRSRIEALYPGSTGGASVGPDDGHDRVVKEKILLLASLLYQCATHTNTSGVFKACHKGFGGHGKDALGRIMAKIQLQEPVLIDGRADSEVRCEDALGFARSRPADLCYLDPPYNQHQYGSNYHLLNTIARWDKPGVDNERRGDGTLKSKAGIRKDWISTRSAFCYRQTAGKAFAGLLEAIDARFIVLSYNTEGIIPFEALIELLSAQGRVELIGNQYVKYRGGKQSLSRRVHNLEFVLVLDRSSSTSPADRRRLETAVLISRLRVMMKRSFRPGQVRRLFAVPDRDDLPVRLNGRTIHLSMPHLYRFSAEAAAVLESALEAVALKDLRSLVERLELCECADRLQEIHVLLEISSGSGGHGDLRDEDWLQKRILWLLRKFAHRKYRGDFERTLGELRSFCRRDPRRFAVLSLGLERVEALARARFAG